MKKVIIFDFDRTIGTLIIDWSEWRKDIKDLILEFEPGSDMSLDNIRHANQNDLIEKYGPKFRIRLNRINEQSEQVLVTDFVVNQKILHYIKTTNNELHCWSSNSKKTLNKYFKEIDIADKFGKIISREDTYFLKPDVEGFELIRNIDTPLDQYLFVGDSEADEIAAKKSGINFIYVDDFDLKE